MLGNSLNVDCIFINLKYITYKGEKELDDEVSKLKLKYADDEKVQTKMESEALQVVLNEILFYSWKCREDLRDGIKQISLYQHS